MVKVKSKVNIGLKARTGFKNWGLMSRSCHVGCIKANVCRVTFTSSYAGMRLHNISPIITLGTKTSHLVVLSLVVSLTMWDAPQCTDKTIIYFCHLSPSLTTFSTMMVTHRSTDHSSMHNCKIKWKILFCFCQVELWSQSLVPPFPSHTYKQQAMIYLV